VSLLSFAAIRDLQSVWGMSLSNLLVILEHSQPAGEFAEGCSHGRRYFVDGRSATGLALGAVLVAMSGPGTWGKFNFAVRKWQQWTMNVCSLPKSLKGVRWKLFAWTRVANTFVFTEYGIGQHSRARSSLRKGTKVHPWLLEPFCRSLCIHFEEFSLSRRFINCIFIYHEILLILNA
jgi:hypothetical protein